MNPNIEVNKLLLNGKEESFENPRLKICLDEIRKRAKRSSTIKPEILEWNLEIESENNFPTAAGENLLLCISKLENITLTCYQV